MECTPNVPSLFLRGLKRLVSLDLSTDGEPEYFGCVGITENKTDLRRARVLAAM